MIFQMVVVTRLILALMFVVQSLPGVGVERCAEMIRGVGAVAVQADSADESSCRCCWGDARGAAGPACGKSDAVGGCVCGMPRPEQPKAPPSEPKSEQVRFALAILPAFLGFMFEGVARAAPPVCWLGAAPKRRANSIQSVLCVWVV